MNLLIVESPTKARTISHYLNPKEYRVLSCYGHIRDLPKTELGVDVENGFKPKYVIPKKAKKHLKPIKEVIPKAEVAILATDEDREGEAIAWHLMQVLGLNGTKNQKESSERSKIAKTKNYQRIVFHEITQKAIEEALKHPRKIDINLVNAQQARRILDRLVGYKLSPFLWKKVFRGLSAGRVQSVAVRLVVEREREIEKFVPQEYWTIEALLLKTKDQRPKTKNQKPKTKDKTKNQKPKTKNEFKALLVKRDGKVIPKLGIKSKKEAEEIVKALKEAEYKVGKIEKKEVKRNPLPPFTTSTLQQESWKRFKWPAKLTMQIAQQLYETGLITYHRTDSLNLSNLALFSAKKFIVENYGKEYWPGFSRKFKAKGRVQEAHEAIRPTFAEKTPEKLKVQKKLEERGFKLYDLIWRRFIACQMAPASFDSTNVEIEAENPQSKTLNPKQIQNSKFKIQNKYTFKATGQILKFDGFLKVYPIKFEERELPPLEKNEILALKKLLPKQHFTQPPARYTEATLIKELEKNGIGRPSTYAPILSTIQERNYVQKDEKKCLRPTETGIIVNDLLVKHFPSIVDIRFTANLEEQLDEIAQGREEWTEVLRNFYEPFEKNLAQKYATIEKKEIVPQEKTNKICPKCGTPLVIKMGRYGKFYSCSRFPECKYKEALPPKKLGIKCPLCKEGNIVEKKTRKGKIFYACDRFPECDFALWDKPTGEKCQKCGSLLVQDKKGQIKCSNKECDYQKPTKK